MRNDSPMPWTDSQFITLSDLYLAYRKAKVNMYYEREHITAEAFCTFEEDLVANLSDLLRTLNKATPTWFKEAKFVGDYSYIPKSLGPSDPRRRASQDVTSSGAMFVSSDADDAWRRTAQAEEHSATFRVVGRHPVAFHVVSALWISKVGFKFDALLDESAYGTRLRRTRQRGKRLGRLTPLSLGSFKPYPHSFRAWRSNGFSAIREALKRGRPVVALTTDLKGFYHEVSPNYLEDSGFLEGFAVKLNDDERRFNHQFIQALKTWAARTPEHRHHPVRGVPVGLSAARIVANVILCGFDRFVARELAPLYYGRYVDDVFLVLDNEREMRSVDDVWRFMIERSNGILKAGRTGKATQYSLHLSYATGSKLLFGNDKQRVFDLSGSSGESLLASIDKTVERLSSEWRMLPEVADDSEELMDDFVSPGHDAAEEVDNLRKADGATVRRLAFALRLRNLEAMQRDLPPDQWERYRAAFFTRVHDHVITAKGLFAYGPYLARLVGLSVASDDWTAATNIVKRIRQVFDLVRDTAKEYKPAHLSLCRQHVLDACFQAAAAAIGPKIVSENSTSVAAAFFGTLSEDSSDPLTLQKAMALGKRLYQRDLAREPFRDFWLANGVADLDHSIPDLVPEIPRPAAQTLRLGDIGEFLHDARLQLGSAVPAAVVFPTRPLRVAEIVQLDQGCFATPARLTRWAKALRGIEASPWPVGDAKAKVWRVPFHAMPLTPSIALPCFETLHASWIACATDTPDPDAARRYLRLNRLINDVLRAADRPQYLVLPELALPRRWFGRIAHKLSQSGVSIITGIEYQHHPVPSPAMPGPHGAAVGFVSNQVWASLVTDALGYIDHITYIQEKERPAPDEESQLWAIGGRVLKPMQPPSKPVIRHGQMQFGILICSELTNLAFRVDLRGRVDVLFVPEWNRDVGTFASLVEASALDIHCFVVQANNRAYGDCRIRAPYRDEFRRDVARVKGGENDYFVIAKVDVDALRRFQSHHRSPLDGKFKPTPDGFVVHSGRRAVPG